MRLLAPLLLAALSALTGFVAHSVFGRGSPRGSMLAGIIGGFAALWLRDLLDIEFGSGIAGGLLATVLGAAVVSIPVALVGRQGQPMDRPDER